MPNLEYSTVALGDSVSVVSGYITMSGGFLYLQDPVTGEAIEITSAGLHTKINNASKINLCAIQTIDGTDRELDLTQLVGFGGYPMDVELEARDSDCYVRQGATGVTLSGSGADPRILTDRWRRITVDSEDDAYIAVKNTGSGTGTLAATRIDSLI